MGNNKYFLAAGVLLALVGVILIAANILTAGKAEGEASLKIYSSPYLISAAYKAYGNERLGFWIVKTVVMNTGESPLYDVKVSYKIEGLTGWSEPHVYAAIPPNGTIVDLYYPKIMKMPELQSPMPSTVHVKVEYKSKPDGKIRVLRESKPLTILGFHDFVFSNIPPEESTGSFQDVFSNAPLLAAWVTYTDPVLQRYVDMANKLSGGAGASLNDPEALEFLNALWTLSIYNSITYQTEPQSYWTGKGSQFIKYPRDVLKDKSGTCIDTAIFIAAAAMSHGLKAYIVLIPGHAFPIVELPSGTLVPIESTLLNAKAGFREAVEKGVEVAQKAFQGPHLVIDVAKLHALGITPPELQQLPPNVLEQWGYILPGQPIQQPIQQEGQGQVEGTGEVTGGGEGGGAGGGQEGESQEQESATIRVTNPLRTPPWSISIPKDWVVESYTDEEPFEVDAYSNERPLAVSVLWSKSYSVEELRSYIESMIKDMVGYVKITGRNENGALGRFKALTIAYDAGDQGLIVARYAGIGGYSYTVVYIIGPEYLNDQTIAAMENIVKTFNIG